MRMIKRITALLLCVSMLTVVFVSCSTQNGIDVSHTLNLSGKVTDMKGNPASGRYIALYSDYKTLRCQIAEDGSYTIDGFIFNDTAALVIEDSYGNIFNEITYFSVVEEKSTGFSGESGDNVYGYINLFAEEDTETLYVNFERGADDYINCTYASKTPEK